MPWTSAYLFCKDHGMDMAILETEEELTTVINLLNEYNPGTENVNRLAFALGGVMGNSLNEWFWWKTGESIDYADTWCKNEPNKLEERCLEFWSATATSGYCLNNAGCTVASSFICQKFVESC